MIAAALLWLSLATPQGAQNRLWYVELELRGPCEEVRLDCGSAGVTRLLGPFLAGEERRLRVPVPVRSPLGLAGLAALPLPRAELEPPTAGAVEVRGWSEQQPASELARQAPVLLGRPRPPLADARARARLPELLVVLLAGGVLLALRRRPLAHGVLALGAGLLAAWLAHGRVPGSESVELVEWDVEEGLALVCTGARGGLPLPRTWLEVLPAGLALELRLRGDGGGGSAHAPGAAALYALEPGEVPRLGALNAWRPLLDLRLRGPRGDWQALGDWALGEPLPAPGGTAGDPPGWLTGALPPGRGVLVARLAANRWLRALGFPPP